MHAIVVHLRHCEIEPVEMAPDVLSVRFVFACPGVSLAEIANRLTVKATIYTSISMITGFPLAPQCIRTSFRGL